MFFDYCTLQITIYYGGSGVLYRFWNVVHNGEERKYFGNWTGKGTCRSDLLETVGDCLRTGPKRKKLIGGSKKISRLHTSPFASLIGRVV
jgi:hypothetical protein